MGNECNQFKTDVAQRTDVAVFVAETEVIENGTELVAAIDAPSVWFDAVPAVPSSEQCRTQLRFALFTSTRSALFSLVGLFFWTVGESVPCSPVTLRARVASSL